MFENYTSKQEQDEYIERLAYGIIDSYVRLSASYGIDCIVAKKYLMDIVAILRDVAIYSDVDIFCDGSQNFITRQKPGEWSKK